MRHSRRSFLKAALWPIYLPLVKVAPVKQAQQEPPEPEYTDSQNNTPATLAALHDGDRSGGGVTYQG